MGTKYLGMWLLGYGPWRRIALDIDSTLHPYWDLLQRIVLERYGVELPYEEQCDWGITALERDAVIHCVEETHSDENILAGVPYENAVETVRDWHAQGHWIHVTSHRARRPPTATARWLERIGMPYDDLHCSFDKVTRCSSWGSTCWSTTARSTSCAPARPGSCRRR